MESVDELSLWCDVFVDAFHEIAEASLFVNTVNYYAVEPNCAKNTPGSYIPLVGDSGSFTFGIQGTWQDFSRLARRFLFIGDEEDVTDEEVVDAVNELCNMTAGGVKKRMVGRDPSLKLGLPTFFTGSVQATSEQESWIAVADLATERFHLVALRQRK